MSNLYQEFQKVMTEMGRTDDQRRLIRWKKVTTEALPLANKRMRTMLRRPRQNTKLAAYVAGQANPNTITELSRSWNPLRVFRHDPKNNRITYEVTEASAKILDDQMDQVGQIVTEETLNAITDDQDFVANLIRDVVHGNATKVTWEGGD